MKISYAIRCPECGFLIKVLDEMPIDFEEFNYCYACEEDIQIQPRDVELIFTLVSDPSCFIKGQHLASEKNFSCAKESRSVAPENTMEDFLKDNLLNINSVLYSPSKAEYEQMTQLYNRVKLASTKTEKGETLENLIKYMMNRVKVFRAGDFRTRKNQLDCFVRNTFLTNVGVLEFIGGRFIIECKNENKTPSGSYISKLHDILSNIDNENSIMKFAMIVSIKKPPKTFKGHAKDYYLRHKTIIISLYEQDLDSIIIKHENLLDVIDRKCSEVVSDSTQNLKAAGLYD